MVFGVEEHYATHYGGRRRKFVGASMHESANYCDFLHVSTLYYTRSGGDFSFVRHVYSLNYAVVTLSIYREDYSLVEMSVPRNWWLVNEVRYNNRIAFQLNGYITPMYDVFTTITTTNGDISITQALNYYYHDNQSTSPTPMSVLF